MMCNRVESLSGEGVILAVRVVELSYCDFDIKCSGLCVWLLPRNRQLRCHM